MSEEVETVDVDPQSEMVVINGIQWKKGDVPKKSKGAVSMAAYLKRERAKNAENAETAEKDALAAAYRLVKAAEEAAGIKA